MTHFGDRPDATIERPVRAFVRRVVTLANRVEPVPVDGEADDDVGDPFELVAAATIRGQRPGRLVYPLVELGGGADCRPVELDSSTLDRLHSATPTMARIAVNREQAAVVCDIADFYTEATTTIAATHMLQLHAEALRAAGATPWFDEAATASFAARVSPSDRSPRARSRARRLANDVIAAAGIPSSARSPTGDYAIGWMSDGPGAFGSESGLALANGNNLAWVRLVESDGISFVRVHGTFGTIPGAADSRPLRRHIDLLNSEVEVVRVATVPAPRGKRRYLIAVCDVPVSQFSPRMLEHMVWAVATLLDWGVDDALDSGLVVPDGAGADPISVDFVRPERWLKHQVAPRLVKRSSNERTADHRLAIDDGGDVAAAPEAVPDAAPPRPRGTSLSPNSTTWREVAAPHLEMLIRRDDVSLLKSNDDVTANDLSVNDLAAAALRLLIAGPAAFGRLTSLASQAGPEAIVGHVDEVVISSAIAEQHRLRALSDAVGAWGRTQPRQVREQMSSALQPMLGTRHPGFEATIDTALGLDDAAPSERLKTIAVHLGSLDVDDASYPLQLVDLAIDSISSGTLMARTAYSASSDRAPLAAVLATAAALHQCSLEPDVIRAIQYLAQPLRAADLLQLRSGDRIGPIVKRRGRHVMAHRRDGFTVFIGPPGCGKSSTLNTVLSGYTGPVVATTTKTGEWEQSYVTIRAERGPICLFDPANKVADPHPSARRIRFDVVQLCTSYAEARRIAWQIAEGTDRNSLTAADFWISYAQSLLGPLLFAANLDSGGIADVLSWNVADRLDRPIEILTDHGHEPEAAQVRAIVETDSRTRDSVLATVTALLAPFSTGDAARLATHGHRFDPFADWIEPNGTVLLCLDPTDTAQLGLLIEIFLSWLIRARTTLADNGWSGPSCLLGGDEIAHVCALSTLPRLIGEGPGRGVSAIVCLQDLSQAHARWGASGDLFLTATGNRVLFPGVTSTALLNWVTPLLGRGTSRPAGFVNRNRSGFDLDDDHEPSDVENVGQVIHPGRNAAVLITPDSSVYSAQQARAQDDPLYCQAIAESQATLISWSILPPAPDEREPPAGSDT